MRKIFIFLSILCCVALLHPGVSEAQSLHHSAVATAGGVALSPSGTVVSYTVGEVAFRTFGGDFGTEEGVQQGFCVPTLDTLDFATCPADPAALLARLPEGTTLPAGVSTRVTGSYQFDVAALSQGGCDSIIRVRLTVHPNCDTTIHAQSSGCYKWMGQDYDRTGDYVKHVFTANGCDSTLILRLTVIDGLPLPEIWNYDDKVVSVQHNTPDFSSVVYPYYRWYRDGELVSEGVGADKYFCSTGCKLDGCFYLEVATDTTRTAWVRSNTVCIGALAVDEVEAPLSFTLAPNPVRVGQVARLSVSLAETQLHGATVAVYDVQGRKIMERAAMPTTLLRCDFPAGVYTVHLLLPGDRRMARKLVVR